jgi:hypothetical protein
MAGVGGASVPGRLSLAGTEARPTELFSYKSALKKVISLQGCVLYHVPFEMKQIIQITYWYNS